MPSLSSNDFVAMINQMGSQLTHLELQGAEELRKCKSAVDQIEFVNMTLLF